MEKILFLTGKLAKENLEKILGNIEPPAFSWKVHELGLQVAGLMTAEMIGRRLDPNLCKSIDKIVVPGRCRGDLKKLEDMLQIPVLRGPEELKDLPSFFNRKQQKISTEEHDILIFAEITDATKLSVEEILVKANLFKDMGADVIDLGCMPDTNFPHLEDSIRLLKKEGFKVSLDSLNSNELERGALAKADYLLSLVPDNLWIAEKYRDIMPIIIPKDPGDIDSLYASINQLKKKGIDFIADSILDPIPFGFVDSIARYSCLRRKYPDIKILVGTGNITELVDADTVGMNALLIGMCAELKASAVLTTQVSDHAKSVVKEVDLARRLMFAARENKIIPKNIGINLLTVHEKKPFLDTSSEIRKTAKNIRDPNYRIQTAQDGLFVYNRDGIHSGIDPFQFYENLAVNDDSSHAFYLGVELARAEVAWVLGKRYAQDKGLEWGVVASPRREDAMTHCQPTIRKKAKNRKNKKK